MIILSKILIKKILIGRQIEIYMFALMFTFINI